jgi:preprotein translocase subunit SecA
MRPYPDEILRSMRHSLDEVIIPAVDDAWARYVAKAMAKMLEHLELRWLHEADLLVEDTRDLHDLFQSLERRLSTEGDPQVTAGVAAALRPVLSDPDAEDVPARSVADLAQRNERYRADLIDVIASLDELIDTAPDLEAELREEVRRFLRREIDRDNTMARPTFMSFAPPKPKEKHDGSG